jgi:hypothetical protein
MTNFAGSIPALVTTADPVGAAVRKVAASFAHYRRAARAMDGAVDAAASGEMTVGRVDDGVNVLGGDVARHQLQHALAKLRLHGEHAPM